MTFMGGFGASDPNFQDKLAKLKARRGAQSGKQRVEEFLEKELHVDPRDLPFTLDAANARMKEIMDGNGSDLVDVVGNSLGLKTVVFKTSNYPDATCTKCQQSSGYWRAPTGNATRHDWWCYECDEADPTVPVPDTTIKTATENDHGGEDWHDLKRCWRAFHAYVKYPAPAKLDEEQHESYSFTVTKDWRTSATEAVEVPTPEADITKYPTGAVLRIQKAEFVNGDMEVERQYVRIGGLFDDTTPTNLETMQPIPDVTGWTVIEEL